MVMEAVNRPPPARPKRPGPLKAVGHILYRLHTVQPLQHEVPPTWFEELVARLKYNLHVTQRTARILGTLLLRTCIRHPLGWTVPQEVVCMLMFGILQSRQVPVWRAFFSGVGDLQDWAPIVKEQVTTGSCVSWWMRLDPDRRPSNPHTSINFVYLHGGAFVAGDALMWAGVYTYWMLHLAKQGIECSILSVEYPLAPEHPFPAGLHAAADAIYWLLHDSGETADLPYFVGGDSAGGNLALAGLTLLRDGGKLRRAPLGITLVSPAVDLSNESVLGSREPVSSHFEQQQQQQQQCQQHSHSRGHGQSHSHGSGHGSGHTQHPSPAPSAAALSGGSFSQQQQQQQQHNNGHVHRNVAQRQLQQQHVPLESVPSIDCSMHAAHTAGGKLRLMPLLRGLVGDVLTAVRAHTSTSSALQVAASGWFDYIPGDSLADELHCYVQDPGLLPHPLVSPTRLQDFSGLCQRGMLVVAGGAEVMRPDIAKFAAKAAAAAAVAAPASIQQHSKGAATGKAAAEAPAAQQANTGAAAAAAAAAGGQSSGGFAVVYHEEPGEPHAYPMLSLPHLLRKGLVVPRFVAAVVTGQDLQGFGRDAAAAAASNVAASGK